MNTSKILEEIAKILSNQNIYISNFEIKPVDNEIELSIRGKLVHVIKYGSNL